MQTFSLVFIAFVVLATATDYWLAARHARHVRAHRGAVPQRFAGVISLEAHQKAADYTLAKLFVDRWAGLWGVALLIIWTLGGGLEWLDQMVRGFGFGGLATGVAVMLGFFVIGQLLEMPFDLWKTFGVEARFGFNKMTPGLYVSDLFKQLGLMLAIGGPLAFVILWLMQGMGSLWWLYAWLVWTAFSLFMIWAFPTFIAPLFNKFTPLEEGEFRSRIEALLARCGFTSKGLFVMDGSKRSAHGNAYFTGLGNAKRIVFFDTLINTLQVDEAEAVLAHELGHFRHGHVKKRLIIMTAMSLAGFAALGWLMQQAWFYQGLGVSEGSNHIALLLFMLVMPVFLFWAGPISSWFSRRHEFEADAYAAAHADAEKLISALVKMYEDNAATLTPDPLYSAWHDSHPPAPVRIAHLEALQ
ncbi:MAG TPA: M48 family metallopeptidase [Mariprofundaceae bacterium]|nr:M48 family metallopeptidase [Mariprofundaceae bacterium]